MNNKITKKQASIDLIIELKKRQSTIGISIIFLFLTITNSFYPELAIINIIGILILIKFLVDTKKQTNKLKEKYGV